MLTDDQIKKLTPAEAEELHRKEILINTKIEREQKYRRKYIFRLRRAFEGKPKLKVDKDRPDIVLLKS